MADPRWDPIRRRSVLLTYPHDDGVSRFISEQSDARLIWGGDETVRYFRSFAAKPTTRDICFADKLSACVINAERYLDLSEAARTEAARAFFNDAYQFDQMACSSPHFVFIAGPERDRPRASAAFWSALSRETSRLAQAESWANAVDKLVAAYQALGRVSGVEWVSRGIGQTPVVIRVPVEAVGVVRLRVGGGFFVESFVEDVGAVAQAIEQADQTLTYIGFTREEMLDAAPLLSVRGIDRIVPVGQALTFGPVWDGYVLFGELTRRVVVG